MSDSLKKIKDFLILGNYLRHCQFQNQIQIGQNGLKPCQVQNQIQFGQNGLKLRDNVFRNYQKSLGISNSQSFLIHSNAQPMTHQILNEQLSSEEKMNLFYSWKDQKTEQPLSFLHAPSTDKSIDTFNVDNFCCTSFTFLSSFNDRWNFSFQDFLRSRRQFWKRLFFDPGTNLKVVESDLTGAKPSATIDASVCDFDVEDFSSNLTVESIRLLDKSEIPKVFEKEVEFVRMVESKSYLSAGTLAILLTSVRKRLFLPTTRLGKLQICFD